MASKLGKGSGGSRHVSGTLGVSWWGRRSLLQGEPSARKKPLRGQGDLNPTRRQARRNQFAVGRRSCLKAHAKFRAPSRENLQGVRKLTLRVGSSAMFSRAGPNATEG